MPSSVPPQPSSPSVGDCGGRAESEFDAATAAVIAHDFNNFLTTILGNLSLVLFNPLLDSATQERLVTAKRAGLRAQELAHQLLTLAKGGAGSAAENTPIATSPQTPETTRAFPTRRVLVLDDEEAICALVTCALEPLGYEVVETHDALTAIALYTDALHTGRRFDLVISDLSIPGGIGGEEAVRRLRELDPSLKAIVSSGYSSDPVLNHFHEHGFSAIMPKPYEIEALGRTVREVLAAAGTPGRNGVEHEVAVLARA